MKRTVVCFAAHADDIEFTCSGALIQLLAQGCEPVYVVLTNGENGFKAGKVPLEERIRIRKAEQQEAARRLGARDVLFLDYRDGFLEYSEELRRRLVEIIRHYRPSIVFSFDPANREYDDLNLFHRDHRIAGEAVFDACFAAKNDWIYPGEPHRVEALHFYGTNRPNHFVDISELIERKLEILASHKSQFPDWPKVVRFVKERISGPHGACRHVEAFRVVQVEQLV